MPRRSSNKVNKSNQKVSPGKKASNTPRPKPTQQIISRNPRARLDHLLHPICGLNDPFCEHADGAKYVDMGSTRTLPYTFRGITNLTTLATGNGSAAFLPNWLNTPITVANTDIGAGVFSYNAMTAAGLLSGVDAVRITSAGVILRVISAPLTTSGYVAIRNYGGSNSTSINTQNQLSFLNCTASQNIPLADCKEFAAVTRRTDVTSSQFRSPTTILGSGASPANWVAPGFEHMTITVMGAPASTAVLQIEFVVHLELVFEATESMATMATHTPKANPMLSDAVNEVSSELIPYAKRGAIEFGKNVLKQAGASLVTMLASRVGLGGPVKALIRDVD